MGIREIGSRIRGLFGKELLDKELDEEMTAHLEMLVEDNLKRGMTLEEARRAARRSFGGVTQTKEAYRDQRGLPIVETLMQDIRYGVRMLRRNPGFTVVAVLTLALGVGANTAIFSVLDAVMLKVLPVRDPARLVLVRWTAKDWPSIVEDLEGSNRKDPAGGGWVSESVPYPVFDALRRQNNTLSDVFAFSANVNGFNVRFDGAPYSALTEPVSGDYFKGLGVEAIIGRPILPSDDEPAAPPVAVMAYNFWKNNLGGDESVVGKTIVINNIPFSIAGVAPPEFFGTQPGETVDVYVSLGMFPRLVQALTVTGPLPNGGDAAIEAAAFWQKPSTWWLVVMGRMKPGVSEAQARADLDLIFTRNVDSMIHSEKD